jgi:flavin-dependent dehydrogenase
MSPAKYDAIVVGARCAGSPTAMLLARKGYRVLLLDRASFPSDHLSTHWIHQPGIARLERWGLRQRLAATGCPPITSITMDFGPFALRGSPPAAGDVVEAYCPRRTVLDKLLVDAAVEAGAELREGFSVHQLVSDGDSVVGVSGRTASGVNVTERAGMVIGADGLHSLVARQVDAPTYNERAPLQGGYYSYWSGVPVDGVEVYVRDRRAFAGFPTHHGLTCIVVGWPHDEFDAYRADIERNYLETLELAPAFAERVRRGRREERFAGSADTPNFFRKPYGPGWALVGDAGYHKDPITAQGISDGFRDAELLAEAIDAGLAGRRPLNDALAEYERSRNEASLAMYDLTCQFAALEPPPAEMQQLLGALRGNQADTDRYMGLIAGTTAIPEFFAPENLGRIMATAQAMAA